MEQERVIGMEPGLESFVESRACKGYLFLDPLGQKLGRVESVFNNGDGVPQYVRVRTGLFGQTFFLIPVVDVAVDHELKSLTLR